MSFFLTKILNALFIDVGNLLAALFFVAALLATDGSRRLQKHAIAALIVLAMTTAFIAVFPVGAWFLRPLENHIALDRPEKIDGIMVLSGDENPYVTETRGAPGLGAVAGRYLKFGVLAHEYPNAKLAFVGGSGFIQNDGNTKNGVVARKIFSDLGIDDRRLVVEDSSKTTFENATNATDLIKPSPDQNWLLVTSASHMPRALATFRHQGWTIFPVPVDYRTTPAFHLGLELALSKHLSEISTALHEYVGLFVYWIRGRIGKPWA